MIMLNSTDQDQLICNGVTVLLVAKSGYGLSSFINDSLIRVKLIHGLNNEASNVF